MPEAFVPVVRDRVVTTPEGREEAELAYRFKCFNHLLPKFERRAFENVCTHFPSTVLSFVLARDKMLRNQKRTLIVRYELIFVEDLNFPTCFRLTL